MTKYKCSLINFEFAIFDNVADSFIGQKVIVKCLDKEIIGYVDSCTIISTKVKLFGDAKGFGAVATTGIFLDSLIEIPLSPSILGRKLDFFGNPIDNLPPIIPITKLDSFYIKTIDSTYKSSEIVGQNDWLIKSQDFEIQKGQSKTIASIDILIPLLNISNLVLIIVELDYQSKKTSILQNLLKQNELEQVTVFFKSQNQNDILVSAFTVSQVANYLSNHLGFDVLILASNADLLQNNKSNNFYFTQKLEQIVSFGVNNSVSLIKI